MSILDLTCSNFCFADSCLAFHEVEFIFKHNIIIVISWISIRWFKSMERSTWQRLTFRSNMTCGLFLSLLFWVSIVQMIFSLILVQKSFWRINFNLLTCNFKLVIVGYLWHFALCSAFILRNKHFYSTLRFSTLQFERILSLFILISFLF